MITSSIAETPKSSGLPSSLPVADWGLALLVLYLVGRELWQIFKKKDESEAVLTNGLIEDLRNTNRNYLSQQNDKLQELIKIQSREQGSVDKLNEHVRGLMEAARIDGQMQRRESVSFLVEVRGAVVRLDSKVDALHRRLDQAGLGLRSDRADES